MVLTDIMAAGQQQALENIRAAVERLWARPLHRYFTDHSVAHSERIVAQLDGLTAGMMQTDRHLAPTEAFVLLAATYLHDIGMQDERFAGGDLETIRARHHEQTAEMIYRVFEDPARAFALPLGDDPGLVEATALVAQGHRKIDLVAPEYEPFPLGGETLRPRLLAALLRFADELDIDYRRVDLELMKLLDLPLDSQLHWWKCHYVSGVSIMDEYIRVAYRFPQSRPDYETLIIPIIEGEIRAKHTALEPIFRQHAVKVAIGQPQVRLMRLVQPLPPEVEALVQEKTGKQQGKRPKERGGTGAVEPARRSAMAETDLQVGGGYTYQWECAILLALNYFFEPVRYNPTLYDLVISFLGRVETIHLEGEDHENGVELEDINLLGGEQRILVQVKTKQAEGERWTLTDPLLLKALYRFYASRFLAEQPAATRFVFLTNRPFNPDLVQIKDALRADTLDDCPEADKLYGHLDRYAQAEKGKSLEPDRFRQMLARTALVEYLAVDTVKANVQAKLQAYGQRDWRQAHAVLFEYFARQSTRAGGGTVTRESIVEALGPCPGDGPAAGASAFHQQGLPTPDVGQPAVDTAALRARLGRLDAVEIESLCLDHFPAVYDRFGRGLRRDEMINLLLDHCRRDPGEAARLAALLT